MSPPFVSDPINSYHIVQATFAERCVLGEKTRRRHTLETSTTAMIGSRRCCAFDGGYFYPTYIRCYRYRDNYIITYSKSLIFRVINNQTWFRALRNLIRENNDFYHTRRCHIMTQLLIWLHNYVSYIIKMQLKGYRETVTFVALNALNAW